MAGRNLREEFRQKRLKWTAIDDYAKYYAVKFTGRYSTGVDSLARTLANTSLDLIPHKTNAEMFIFRKPLRQEASWPVKLTSARPLKRRWCIVNAGPSGLGGAHRSTPRAERLTLATYYDMTIE